VTVTKNLHARCDFYVSFFGRWQTRLPGQKKSGERLQVPAPKKTAWREGLLKCVGLLRSHKLILNNDGHPVGLA